MAYGSLSHSALPSDFRRPAWFLNDRWTWYVWLAFVSCIAAVVIDAPGYRTVTNNYRDACLNWFAGQPIYTEGKHGFLYFPHAAILFAPFAHLPFATGEVLWRAASIGGLAWATWRWSRLLAAAAHVEDGLPSPSPNTTAWEGDPSRVRDPAATRRIALPADAVFGLMTLVSIPPAIASARNGQMNLMLTALTALAFAAIAESRWRVAAGWLCLGAAMKPLTLVPIGIAAITYRPLRLPVVLGAAALLVFPFATQHASYVWEQYQICLEKLFLAGNPGHENPGSDLFGLLSALGCAVPVQVQSAIRGMAGIGTVVLAWLTLRRQDSLGGAKGVLLLTTCYLALFNPRMENNGFVIIAPALACLASEAFSNRRQSFTGGLLVLASIGIAASYEITRGPNFWLSPLLTLIVLSYAIYDSISSRRS